MAVSVVQTTMAGPVVNSAPLVLTFPSTPTPGNVIVLIASNSVGDWLDAPGMTQDAHGVDNTRITDIYRRTVPASPSASWSFTPPGTTATSRGYAYELAGVDTTTTLDKSVVGTAGTYTTTGPGSSGTLAQADEFAIGAVGLGGASGGGESVTGLTLRDTVDGGRLIVADKIVSSTAALDPQFSWTTSRRAVALMVTYRAATAPPAPTYYPAKMKTAGGFMNLKIHLGKS